MKPLNETHPGAATSFTLHLFQRDGPVAPPPALRTRGVSPAPTAALCRERDEAHVLSMGFRGIAPRCQAARTCTGGTGGARDGAPSVRALLPSPHPGVHWRISSCLALITPLCPFYYKEGENQRLGILPKSEGCDVTAYKDPPPGLCSGQQLGVVPCTNLHLDSHKELGE